MLTIITLVVPLLLVLPRTLSQVYPATFTNYNGCHSGNSCGYSPSGYTAAISEWMFQPCPSGGSGKACGSCWKLTLEKDYNGNSIPTNTQVVTINNECPANGNNVWCAQKNPDPNATPNQGNAAQQCTTDNPPKCPPDVYHNALGGAINFDLCDDDGTKQAILGSNGMGSGHAEMVPCPGGQTYLGPDWSNFVSTTGSTKNGAGCGSLGGSAPVAPSNSTSSATGPASTPTSSATYQPPPVSAIPADNVSNTASIAAPTGTSSATYQPPPGSPPLAGNGSNSTSSAWPTATASPDNSNPHGHHPPGPGDEYCPP